MTIAFGIVAGIQCFIEISIFIENITVRLRCKAVEAMCFVDDKQIKLCVVLGYNLWNVKR